MKCLLVSMSINREMTVVQINTNLGLTLLTQRQIKPKGEILANELP